MALEVNGRNQTVAVVNYTDFLTILDGIGRN